MFTPGTTELIVIGVIVLLIFGAKRLPEIGKGIGGAIREFKQVKKDLVEDNGSSEANSVTQNGESKKEEKPRALEEKVGEKVLEQLPGAKEVINAKKKVDKVKDFINS